MKIHFLLSIMLLPILVWSHASSQEFSTAYPTGIQRLLSRKRRYLLFPPGSGLTCIFSMVKGIIFNYPTGYNTVSEMNFVYDLPDTMFYIKKWKALQNKFGPKAPKTTKAPVPEEIISWNHPHKTAWGSWNTWNPNSSISFPEEVDHSSWGDHDEYYELKHHRSYKERRDLYQNIEHIIDVMDFKLINRFCILKAICEAQHFLLPKGSSLFHDIFRILFTVPITSKTSPELRNAMTLQEHECDLVFKEKCPMSILQMFLQSGKLF
ncbi:uncharacterized protein LOC129796877 [Lutzomyia longipalpis]|uniref:uncharacterized protein LOC129796877 n=1 Tax=Lutzomyia longipalpis TaxID=7200 RepID=UPI002483931C|nr:uncharacterized protein LOC129796877 [Lutzomyia longipalpis]